MLGQILAELVVSMLGEAVMEALFPAWSKPEPLPEEGTWNASLGSMAAFLAAVAAMLGAMPIYAIMVDARVEPSRFVTGGYVSVVGGMLAASVIVALVAGMLAQRTFLVTRRRHALAHVGLWLSRATVAMAVVAVAFAVFGVVRGE